MAKGELRRLEERSVLGGSSAMSPSSEHSALAPFPSLPTAWGAVWRLCVALSLSPAFQRTPSEPTILGPGSDMNQEVLSVWASVSHPSGSGGKLGPFQLKRCDPRSRKLSLILPSPAPHAHWTLPRCFPGYLEAPEASNASSSAMGLTRGREIPEGSVGEPPLGFEWDSSCVTCEAELQALENIAVWGPFSERLGTVGKAKACGL